MDARKLSPTTIAEKINELPTLPTVVHELTQIIHNPMASSTAVEKLLASDQSLTTKLLKLANTAYYAVPGGASSLSRAITYMGYNTVHQLVVATSVFKTFETSSSNYFNLKDFWKHAVGVAIAAETIGKFLKIPSTHELFTGGLIHDMGKIALHQIEPAMTDAIVFKANTEALTYLQAEIALDIPSHSALGFLLAERWGLSKTVQTIVRYHHPQEVRPPLETELAKVADIVALANIFIHVLRFGSSGHQGVTGVPRDLLQRLNLEPHLKTVLNQIRLGLVKSSGFVNVLEGPRS